MHAQQVKSKSSAIQFAGCPFALAHISICFEWDKFGIELIHDACLIAALFEQFLELSCRKNNSNNDDGDSRTSEITSTNKDTKQIPISWHNANNNIYNSENVARFHYGFIVSMHVCFLCHLPMTTVNLLHCVLRCSVRSFYLINWMCVFRFYQLWNLNNI